LTTSLDSISGPRPHSVPFRRATSGLVYTFEPVMVKESNIEYEYKKKFSKRGN
jgi:hypothetical protein